MEQLSELASEAARLPLQVVVTRNLPDGVDGSADLGRQEISLAPAVLYYSPRDAAAVFLHETYHAMEAHTGQNETQERAADAFAQAVLERVGSAWFAYAAQGSMLQAERQKVLAAMEECAGPGYRAARRSLERMREESRGRVERAVADDVDMEFEYAEYRQQKALYDKWEREGKLEPKGREIMLRSIVRRARFIVGEPDLPVTREYVMAPIEASVKDGIISGKAGVR